MTRTEGPCCAGKTTLGRALLDGLPAASSTYVADYQDHVRGREPLPPPMPASLAEEEESIGIFLRLEAERTRIQRASAVDLILIDRSVHTLLAHCHALEQLTGERYSALAERILRRSTIPLWPDLVIYLDLPEGAVHLRNHGKFSADSIFIDPAFNAGIRSYFGGLARAGAPKVIWIDSTLGAETVRQLVGAEISSLPIS